MTVSYTHLDVYKRQHPHSAIAEVLFGVKFTKSFRDIVEGGVSIKHEAWNEVNHMLDGKLTPYIPVSYTHLTFPEELRDKIYGLTLPTVGQIVGHEDEWDKNN